jgi:hypothetical protein
MAVKYKQKCSRCKKHYVLASWRKSYVLCYECEKKDLNQEIKDPKMKKLFNIPEEFYKENSFLRSIKLNYFRFENLSDKQIEVFKKVVKDMKKEAKEKVAEAKAKTTEVKETKT